MCVRLSVCSETADERICREGKPRNRSYSLKPFLKPLIVGKFSSNLFWNMELEEEWRRDFFKKARHISSHGTMVYFQREDFPSATTAMLRYGEIATSLGNENRILVVIEPKFAREFLHEYSELCERLRKEEDANAAKGKRSG